MKKTSLPRHHHQAVLVHGAVFQWRAGVQERIGKRLIIGIRQRFTGSVETQNFASLQRRPSEQPSRIKKQTELNDYYVDLQRHIFGLCSTDLAGSGGVARKRVNTEVPYKSNEKKHNKNQPFRGGAGLGGGVVRLFSRLCPVYVVFRRQHVEVPIYRNHPSSGGLFGLSPWSSERVGCLLHYLVRLLQQRYYYQHKFATLFTTILWSIHNGFCILMPWSWWWIIFWYVARICPFVWRYCAGSFVWLGLLDMRHVPVGRGHVCPYRYL